MGKRYNNGPSRPRNVIIFLFCLIFIAGAAQAEVLRVEISSRVPVLNGKIYGEFGSYEMISGTVFFGFDPANPMNSGVVDLELAPRNANGLVEANANFVVLQPTDPIKNRGTALVEVSNRGGKFSLRYFNRTTSRTVDAEDPGSFGNEMLMREGFTVIWIGWQYDVPERENILRLIVPRVRNIDGTPIYGLVRSDWTVDRPEKSLLISHRNHIAYPVCDPEHEDNVLTVRDGRETPRRVIPRTEWEFAREENGNVTPDNSYIYLRSGFVAGNIYELVYRAKNPAVVGLGLAAIRDIISYAKYNKEAVFPVKYGIAAGVSQTGRFLRHFLYQGFNTDEKNRRVYDGLMIITAGAGRGSFNHRFAQPSRDAHRYSAFFYPTDIFPFSSKVQQDSDTWQSDGLLAHPFDPENTAKTFYINTGYEYWGRAASLIHTTPEAAKDVEPEDHERIYHLSSGQHYVGRFPPRSTGTKNIINAFRGNHLDFSVNYRSLLIRLTEWVESGKLPPQSRYPRIDNGTLVNINDLNYPFLPGVSFPQTIHVAYRADYGPRWFSGIVDFQPPKLRRPFTSKVSQIDKFGNEIAGIRNVELRVPLATYMPWNLRTGFAGGSHELTDFTGTFIPLPRTNGEKNETGDPRPSLDTLYGSREVYLSEVTNATRELISEGFLLDEDLEYVVGRAGRYWDWIHSSMVK